MASFVRRFLSTDSGMMGFVSLLTMAGMLLKVPAFARTKERVDLEEQLGGQAQKSPKTTGDIPGGYILCAKPLGFFLHPSPTREKVGKGGRRGITMADMSAIRALQKAERLVSTIARAFYTDNTVLVVDTLIREK